MRMHLLFQALYKLLFSIAVTTTLIFVSAGTLHYWNGWMFLCIWFLPMILLGTILLIKNPELLKKDCTAKKSTSHKSLSALWVFLCFSQDSSSQASATDSGGFNCLIGSLGSALYFLAVLPALCRSNAGKHLSITNGRGSKGSKYRLVCNRTSSYVCCYNYIILFHPFGAGFWSLFYYCSWLSHSSGQANQKRRNSARERLERLYRI